MVATRSKQAVVAVAKGAHAALTSANDANDLDDAFDLSSSGARPSVGTRVSAVVLDSSSSDTILVALFRFVAFNEANVAY